MIWPETREPNPSPKTTITQWKSCVYWYEKSNLNEQRVLNVIGRSECPAARLKLSIIGSKSGSGYRSSYGPPYNGTHNNQDNERANSHAHVRSPKRMQSWRHSVWVCWIAAINMVEPGVNSVLTKCSMSLWILCKTDKGHLWFTLSMARRRWRHEQCLQGRIFKSGMMSRFQIATRTISGRRIKTELLGFATNLLRNFSLQTQGHIS